MIKRTLIGSSNVWNNFLTNKKTSAKIFKIKVIVFLFRNQTKNDWLVLSFNMLLFFNNKTLVHLKGECQDNLIRQPGQTFEPLIFSNCNLLTVWYIQSH
jgi:hypothetical protein